MEKSSYKFMFRFWLITTADQFHPVENLPFLALSKVSAKIFESITVDSYGKARLLYCQKFKNNSSLFNVRKPLPYDISDATK